MKKIFALTLSVLMILGVFCGCKPENTGVLKDARGLLAATVGEQKIYTEQIHERIRFNELKNDTNKKYINKVFYEYEREQQLESLLLPNEYDSVLDTLIEGCVIRDEAEKIGVFVDYDKAKSLADSEYSLLKTDASQKNFYDILVSELSNKQIDEEKYLSMLYEYSYDYYNYTALMEYFKNTKFDSKSNNSLEEQFKDYVKGLVTKTSVKTLN